MFDVLKIVYGDIAAHLSVEWLPQYIYGNRQKCPFLFRLWKNKSGDGEKAEVNLTIDPSGRVLEPGVSWEQASFDD